VQHWELALAHMTAVVSRQPEPLPLALLARDEGLGIVSPHSGRVCRICCGLLLLSNFAAKGLARRTALKCLVSRAFGMQPDCAPYDPAASPDVFAMSGHANICKRTAFDLTT
jgi:hypothetical protein